MTPVLHFLSKPPNLAGHSVKQKESFARSMENPETKDPKNATESIMARPRNPHSIDW
jgi:hypothetical protein